MRLFVELARVPRMCLLKKYYSSNSRHVSVKFCDVGICYARFSSHVASTFPATMNNLHFSFLRIKPVVLKIVSIKLNTNCYLL